MTATEIRSALIPTASVVPSPHQNREDFDPVELAQLAESIAQTGQLQAIRVRPAETGPLCADLSLSSDGSGTSVPGYVLIAGERRLRAIRDVLGWETIRAEIVEENQSPLARAIGTLAENMIRVDPNPLEEARGLAAALELDQEMTAGELGSMLGGKSAQWVRDRIELLKLADDVAHYVAQRQLPIKRGVMIADLDVNRQRLALQAHQRRVSADVFAELVAKLAADQAAEGMDLFDAGGFLKVEEWTAAAEESVADRVTPDAPVVVREVPWGVAEIADALEVKPSTVSQWRARGIFPAPELRVGGSPAWWAGTVETWARETGR